MKDGMVITALVLLVFACGSCSTSRKAARLGKGGVSASISLPSGRDSGLPQVDTGLAAARDTIKVMGLDGREVLIMRAVKDEKTGEMVATEQIDAAVVSARFRNVAERHGKVDLEFQVTVPAGMHDSRWQLRLHPDMFIMGDSLRLEDVVITGADYRKAQLRGYEQYQRFVSRIVDDTLHFVNIHELEVFLERNLPEVYAFRNDSTLVSDEQFESVFGVTEHQAVDHYTNMIAWRRNERRRGKMEKMWRRYVKSPIVTEGIRLDTVIRALDGSFVYSYVQTIATRPALRKVDIRLGGDIYEQDRRIYTIPVSEPLTFYISSVSSLVDGTDRYLTKIISRRVEAATVSHIAFAKGKWELDGNLEDNALEFANIRKGLRDILVRQEFELDSLVIVASASPEGSFSTNSQLSLRRAASVSGAFSRFVAAVRDSLTREAGMFVEFDGSGDEGSMHGKDAAQDFALISRSGGENWPGLDDLVINDKVLSEQDKEEYFNLAGIQDVDAREKAMASRSWYQHLSEELYPRLRTVTFNLHLHRKGMVQDTVHTTVLDSVYMAGVQAVRDRDYEAAVEILAPYQDYNTAVAYVALDRNLSALNILNACSHTARVNYMLALVHSRLGDDQKALECYLKACSQDGTFIHRGNLDPEISSLIKRYRIDTNEQTQ